MLPERAFQKRPFGGMTLEGGSGGGGGGHTTSTVTQSSIPDWLRPQTEALLGAATQETFQTQLGPDGTYQITGVKPYTPYSADPRDYFAQFSPLQQQAMGEVAGMQTPGGFGVGQQMTGLAGLGGLQSAMGAYDYGQMGAGYGAAGAQLGTQGGAQYGGLGSQYGGMAANLAPAAQQYGALGSGYGMMGAALAPEAQRYGAMGAGYGGASAGLAPEAQQYGRAAADIGSMGLRAEELGRDVGQEARGYARQAADMGSLYERMATDPRSIQAYMSPYQQRVTEVAKRKAVDDAQRAQLGQNLASVRTGTYGGARQALLQGQREAGLQQQLSDIEAQGLQRAFEQAQQAQQFGVTTGLQGLQGAQSGLGTALQGGQLGLSGVGQAMAGQEAGMRGLGQAGQLYGLGMQGAQAGLAGLGRAGEMYGLGLQGAQSGLAGLGRAGEMYGLGMQGAGYGLQGVQQQLAGTAQGMQGAGYGLQGVSGAQAGYGLTGQMGQSLANIAQQQQAADIARLNLQQQFGAMSQEQQQKIINQAIQNYAMAQENPQQRLAAYNALLRGYQTPVTTVSQYQASPSPVSQLAGLGLTGAAAYGLASGKKEGGKIEEGIDTLALQKAMKKVAA